MFKLNVNAKSEMDAIDKLTRWGLIFGTDYKILPMSSSE